MGKGFSVMKDKKNWIIVGLVVAFLGYIWISNNPQQIEKVKSYFSSMNPLSDSVEVKARARAIAAGQTYLMSKGKDSGGDDNTPKGICPDCDGLGTVGDSRIRKKCETCNGTGKLN